MISKDMLKNVHKIIISWNPENENPPRLGGRGVDMRLRIFLSYRKLRKIKNNDKMKKN